MSKRRHALIFLACCTKPHAKTWCSSDEVQLVLCRCKQPWQKEKAAIGFPWKPRGGVETEQTAEKLVSQTTSETVMPRPNTVKKGGE